MIPLRTTVLLTRLGQSRPFNSKVFRQPVRSSVLLEEPVSGSAVHVLLSQNLVGSAEHVKGQWAYIVGVQQRH